MEDYHKPKQQQDEKAKIEAHQKELKKYIQQSKESNKRHVSTYYGGTNPLD